MYVVVQRPAPDAPRVISLGAGEPKQLTDEERKRKEQRRLERALGPKVVSGWHRAQGRVRSIWRKRWCVSHQTLCVMLLHSSSSSSFRLLRPCDDCGTTAHWGLRSQRPMCDCGTTAHWGRRYETQRNVRASASSRAMLARRWLALPEKRRNRLIRRHENKLVHLGV